MYFNKSIDTGDSLAEWGHGLIKEDTGYVGMGAQFSDTSGAISPAFFEFNRSGELLFRNVLSRPYSYALGGGRSFIERSTWDLLSCGAVFLDTVNYTTDSGRAYLMAWDTNGQLKWEKWYGGSEVHAKFHDLHEDEEGNIWAVGKIFSTQWLNSCDVYLVKVDSQGNTLWERTYGGGEQDQASSIAPHGDGYLLFGRTESYGGNDIDPYVIKVDSNGQKLWEKNYGTTKDEGFGLLSNLPSSGYIGIGARRYSSNKINFLVLKFNDSLDLLWDKEIGHPELDQSRMYPLIEPDGSILFGGDYRDTSRAGDPLVGLLIKADSNGNVLWERDYTKLTGNGDNHYLTTLKRAHDEGYMLYGLHTDYTNQGQEGQNLWLVKVDSMGCDTPDCVAPTMVREPSVPASEDLQLYPNPVRERLTVQSPPSSSTAPYRVYNSKGAIVKEGRLREERSVLQVGQLPSGLYILRIHTDEGVKRKRFVKE